MKLKKYISLLLLIVYLCTTGATAYASISCHCIGANSHSHVENSCCQHCDHAGDTLAAKADFAAPCCGDHHSTDIKLYTGVSSEGEKSLKSQVTDLPPTLATECRCPAHIPSLREQVAERHAPFVRAAWALPVGFRGPPVLA